MRLRSMTLFFAVNVAVHSGAAASMTFYDVTFPGTDWPLPQIFT